jgi:hypothetical protein
MSDGANVDGRRAANENLLREANERIRQVTKNYGGLRAENEFLCECGARDCVRDRPDADRRV